MGKLQARFDGLNRRTLIRVGLPLGVLLRLDSIRRQTGQSREEVIDAAVEEWSRRHEASLTRQRRLELQRRLSRASDGVSIDQLAEDFLADSGEEPGHSSNEEGFRRSAVYNQPMPVLVPNNLKARRLAVGFTQQGLAEAAECSIQVLRLYENGIIPAKSTVLPRITRALKTAEEQEPS